MYFDMFLTLQLNCDEARALAKMAKMGRDYVDDQEYLYNDEEEKQLARDVYDCVAQKLEI